MNIQEIQLQGRNYVCPICRHATPSLVRLITHGKKYHGRKLIVGRF